MTNKELIIKSYEMIRDLKQQLSEAKESQTKSGDIAVVGMACRFPGGCDTPSKYWEFLKAGEEGLTDIPKDRWDIDEYYDPVHGTPGKMYIRKANFLKRDVTEFDAKFFKISPTEAEAMDPQQRQLLEVTYEALENAGENPDELVGSKTGVYVGINSSCEYALAIRGMENVNQYVGTGTISSIAAGRISYAFGFNGPTLSLDTACSSSLVSTLLAVDALRNNNCDMALAGGVSLMLSPAVMSSLCMMNALSDDGRCAPFDEKADGYGRGEGIGMLVLKRLEDAKRDNNNIMALICGGAINNDGASSGLTVPNGTAQKALIAEAIRKCGYAPEDISYLETHGTGTALGDPIEVKAIQDVYGNGKRKNPLIIGAVKGNIGHLESAAGVASLIKVILSLQNKQIVPVVNHNKINPRINFDSIPAVLPLKAQNWDVDEGKERIAGVSSFGFSGTNAHIIIKEGPSCGEKQADDETKSNILTVSAKTYEALNEYIKRYSDFISQNADIKLGDLCFSANTGKAVYAYRASFCAKSLDDMHRQLKEYCNDCADLKKAPITTNPKYAFVFTGRIDNLQEKAENMCRKYSEFKKLYCKIKEDLCENLNETFAFEMAMYEWLKKVGVTPEIVAGKGVGTLVALIACGAVNTSDALKLLNNDNGAENISISRAKIRYVSGSKVNVNASLSLEGIIDDIKADIDLDKIYEYLYSEGYGYYVEIGDDYTSIAKKVLNFERKVESFILPGGSSCDNCEEALSQMFTCGTNLVWKNIYESQNYNRIVLPNYPFAKNSYSIATDTVEDNVTGIPKRGLDGKILNLPVKSKQAEYIFTLDNFRELNDNSGVVHLGYFLEMLSCTYSQIYDADSINIDSMEFLSPVLVNKGGKKHILLVYEDVDDNTIEFTFYSKELGESNWTKNVKGIIKRTSKDEVPKSACTDNISDALSYSSDDFYKSLDMKGLKFGKAVRWIDSITTAGSHCLVSMREADDIEKKQDYYIGFHPGIVDACAQVYNFVEPIDSTQDQKCYMVSYIGNVYVKIAHCNLDVKSEITVRDNEVGGEFTVTDTCGKLLMHVGDVRLKEFDEEKIAMLSGLISSGSDSSMDREFITEYVNSDEKVQLLTQYVKKILADILKMQAEDIADDENVDSLGMDSMSGMMFHRELTGRLGINVSFVDIMEGGTCKGTAENLMNYMPGGSRCGMENKDYRTPYDADLSPEHWIYDYKKKPEAKLRMFCFPYGFGSASMYKDWQEYFGDNIDICAIKIPGLDSERMKEMPAEDIDSLMDTINTVIENANLLDIPCVTFGNSWGSLFSYRLAKRLSCNPKSHVLTCFISGYTSPSLPNTSLYQILDELGKIGYDHIPTESEIRQTSSIDEMCRAFISAWGQSVREGDMAIEGTKLSLPLIAAAYRLIEKFHYDENEQFDIPIVGFHGIDDYRVPLEDMNAWENVTTKSYKMYTVPGDHEFIMKNQSEERVLKLLRENVTELITG